MTINGPTITELFERLRTEEVDREEYAGGEDVGEEIGFVFTSTNGADDAGAFSGPRVRAARRRASTHRCDVIYIAPTTDSWVDAASVERCIERGAAGLV